MITRRALLEALGVAVALGRSKVHAAAQPTSGAAVYPNLFSPMKFRTFTAKNRVFRSNVSGRFDNYDGSGTQTRINWELKFARGGVGAIISSFVPVAMRGRIMPNYATIDTNDRIPFWKELIKQVHQESDCKYLIQLSHGGRQRDVPGIEFEKGLSSTDRADPLHGFECERMTVAQIGEVARAFAAGAARAQAAGADGIELHGANGYLITQFLSSGINDRKDEYGGSLNNRARFLLDIVREIRKEVGPDFHLQMKISAIDFNDALDDDEAKGNTLDDSVQVCRWLEEAGVDAIHVSSGSYFPHPTNPAGELPIDELKKTYDTLISSGLLTFRNYLFFRGRLTGDIFKRRWDRARGDIKSVEGMNLPNAHRIKQAVKIPVLCTGGFQTASVIEQALAGGLCDAVTIARPLIANNNLVQMFANGENRPARPCTYCNKCLVNAVENPLGCYEPARFSSRDEMVREIMTVFKPSPFA
jgi:2,4-dienoyl-CoA reductase-like NADH-dependent reductase (Old Yellow Enzyme family)